MIKSELFILSLLYNLPFYVEELLDRIKVNVLGTFISASVCSFSLMYFKMHKPTSIIASLCRYYLETKLEALMVGKSNFTRSPSII